MAASPIRSAELQQLLEFAAGCGFNNTADSPPEEQALIHSLLAICTRRMDTGSGSRSVAAINALGGGDITLPLLHLCGTTCGVAQALALQALKTWADDHEGCTQACVRAGGVPLLLSVFAACLPVSAADVAAAYSASLAVILLRSMVREGGDEGAAAFLGANGVAAVIGLLTRLHADADNRSLCLVLYLLNDVTRRSAEILDKAVAAGAVDKVVEVLSQPVSEATKFAALILNRWSLAAQHLDAIRGAGAADALLGVLEACCSQSQQQAATTDPETAAYALSAFSIMTQDAVSDVRGRLLSSPAALAAFSAAVPLYEQCFKGVGFPHALMSMLLDGAEGAAVVAALASRGLLPLWLAARHVGGQLAARAAQPDALAAMAALCHPAEALEVSIAAAELAHAYPAPRFLSDILLDEGRLERLTQAALGELIGRSDSAGAAPTTPPAAAPAPAPLDPAGSSGLEAWTAAGVVAQEGATSPGEEVNQQQQQQHQQDMEAEEDGAAAGPGGDATPAPGPRCSHVDSELRPAMSLSMSSSMTTPWPGAKLSAAAAAAAGPVPDRAVAALGRLAALARHAAARAAGAPLDADSPEPALKRQRTGEGSMACLAFRREDVGVQRYDTLCFEVGGREVHAVGFVLETHSSFLRGLLSTVGHVGERVVVPALPAFEPDAMHRLFLRAVEWCYTGEVEGLGACPDAAFELWALAEFLQIDGLQRHCEAAAAGWFAPRPEVALRALALAEAYASAEPLRALVARHVVELVVDGERAGEAAMVVAAAAAAGHAETLGAAMAAQMREDLRAAAAAL